MQYNAEQGFTSRCDSRFLVSLPESFPAGPPSTSTPCLTPESGLIRCCCNCFEFYFHVSGCSEPGAGTADWGLGTGGTILLLWYHLMVGGDIPFVIPCTPEGSIATQPYGCQWTNRGDRPEIGGDGLVFASLTTNPALDTRATLTIQSLLCGFTATYKCLDFSCLGCIFTFDSADTEYWNGPTNYDKARRKNSINYTVWRNLADCRPEFFMI